MTYTFSDLMEHDGFDCTCGKKHYGLLKDCIIGENAMAKLPEILNKYNCRYPFLLCDRETYAAAGEAVCRILNEAGVKYALHCITRTRPAPDERIVGEAIMFCDAKCDAVVAIGGGVINDTGKIVAANRGMPDIYVATAPSMDGFASASSSMERAGLKVSLNSQCPDVVIGDAAVLASAPVHMIRSGIGDMVAKYVSIVEWQIASLLVGEYYCPVVAGIVQNALAVCVENATAAVGGDKDAVCRLTEGLVMSGLAMNYAGISRPASGMEHYISHILDMRGLEFGTPTDFHGIQCGIGTLVTLQAYEKLAKLTPNREKGLAYASAFDKTAWADNLRTLLGHGAEAMIAGEEKEGKYDKTAHGERLIKILANWDTILATIETLPSSAWLRDFFASIGHPVSGTSFGVTEEDMRQAFLAAKDIRDKYVLGRLLWDLGELETMADGLMY